MRIIKISENSKQLFYINPLQVLYCLLFSNINRIIQNQSYHQKKKKLPVANVWNAVKQTIDIKIKNQLKKLGTQILYPIPTKVS